MKLEPSRFSSHCMLIAVLALVAGIAVTVEAAAQQVGIRTIVAERGQNSFVMQVPTMEMVMRSHIRAAGDVQAYHLGKI